VKTGIGYSVSEAVIESGSSVTISSSSPDRVKSAVSKLQTSYPSAKVTGQVCDLSKPTVEQDIEALFEKVGKVDHIVFTAGDKLAALSIQEITLEAIHKAGQIRFAAPLLVAKIGSKYLNQDSSSSIVLTTGSVAENPIPNWSVVAGYAAALHGLTRNLAIDLKPIRVNLVSPGGLQTELWKDMNEGAKAKMYEGWAKTNPTGHAGTPEEVAEAYLWLMKDSNVTGQVATSDSGAHL
jgi:NAD(P)-dependent dehydrogenase (short-subunit alcohol dehydrogenase family)